MKTLLFLTSLALLTTMADASTVYIASNALSTSNNSGDPTVDLTGGVPPNPAWAPALFASDWISYGPTGSASDPGYFAPANGTDVTFSTQFFLSGVITGGVVRVLADDTTSVTLNGHLIVTGDMTPGAACAAGPIGCLTSTEGILTFAELEPYLVDGENTLSFGVVQVAGSSYGLDFDGVFHTTSDPAPTPEPATLGFMGAGLMILAAVRKRR
jgi:hypothetical protein